MSFYVAVMPFRIWCHDLRDSDKIEEITVENHFVAEREINAEGKALMYVIG